MGMDEVMKFVVEKRKYLERERERGMGMGMGMGVDEVMKFVVKALLAVENSGGDALAWLDNVFPPETRSSKASHWFHVALLWIIAAVALKVLLYICRYCCYGGDRARGRMMKAPGRNRTMLRSKFQANPQGYFKKLRAHPRDHLS